MALSTPATPPNTATEEWKAYWKLPIVAALGYATSVIYVYAIGPFIEPIQAEFGWTRAQVSFGITIAAFISAVCCIPMGMLVDKIGPRKVALFGAPAMCAAFAVLGSATGSDTNWVALWVLIALASLFVQATVWSSAVTSRFSRSRGMALAVTLSGASISATIFPMLAAWLIQEYNWRDAFLYLGSGWAILVFPLLYVFFRSAKDTTHIETGEPVKELPGLTLREGFRSPILYKLLLAGGCFAFTAIGIIVHFVPIMKSFGSDAMTAAGIASLIGVFSIIGRIGTGFLLDRIPGYLVGGTAFLLPLLACGLLLLDGSNTAYQTLAAAIFGLTLGSEVDVIAYLAAKYFGLKNFAALHGALVMALSCGTAFGPLAAGAVFDHYQGYEPFLMLTMAFMLISAICLFSLKNAPPARFEGEHDTYTAH